MSTVVISYDGTPITDDVVLADAVFISMVNGQPGSCQFRVRDPDRDKSFTVGKKLTVTVDGEKVWAGYLLTVNRVYGFSDTEAKHSNTRFLLLKGADNNILFKKRVLHRDTNAKDVIGRTWPSPTSDLTVLADLHAHWLDLDPEIDTTALVSGVGAVNVGEQSFQTYGGGYTWGDAMDQIARSNGAVYYLTPDFELAYGDVDTENAPFSLSDQPWVPEPDPVIVFSDSFARTVARGLGGSWVWSNDDSTSGDPLVANAYVNGSEVVLPFEAEGGGTNYESFRGFTTPDAGTARFDFWVTSLAGQIEDQPSYGLSMRASPIVSIYVGPTATSGEWLIGSRLNVVGSATFNPDPLSWYTAEIVYDASSNAEFRVWKQGGTRPASPALTMAPITTTWGSTPPYLDFYYSGVNEDAKVDNVFIWEDAGPSGDPGSKGYREFSIVHDGSGLINDALLIGAGGGSATPVVKRETDGPSMGVHDRWQSGAIVSGVWKQSTIDKIAHSIVYGSPNSHRGAKDDRVSVDLTTTNTGLLPGHRVHVYSHAHGWDDILPIRKMEIRFPSPTQPIYRLTLSHEIDQPFMGLIDPVKWSVPKPTKPQPPKPPPPIPPVIDGGCDSSICGITDTFTRTTVPFDGSYYYGNNWGMSDAGTQWQGSSVYTYVDGSSGVLGIVDALDRPGSSWNGQPIIGQQAYLPLTPTSAFDGTVTLVASRTLLGPDDYDYGDYLEMWVGPITLRFSGGHGLTDFPGTEIHYTSPVSFTSPFNVRVTRAASAATAEVRVWAVGGTEPSSPTFSVALGSGDMIDGYGFFIGTDRMAMGPALEFRADNLDIEGLNRCSQYRFDNFNRTVAGGWGISDAGHTWGGDTIGVSVNGSEGILAADAVFGAANLAQFISFPEQLAGDFVLRAWFTFDVSPSIELLDQLLEYAFDTGWVQFAYATMSTVDITVGDNEGSHLLAGVSISPTQPFFVRVHSDATALSMKFWQADSAEPETWSFTGTPKSVTTGTLYVRADADPHGAVTACAVTLHIDYIDFDYAGKPCYQDCSGITDTFNRVDGSAGIADCGLVWYGGVDVVDNQLDIPGDGSSGTLTAPMPFPFFSSIQETSQLGSTITGYVGVGLNDDHYVRVEWNLANEEPGVPLMRLKFDGGVVVSWTDNGTWWPTMPMTVELNVNGTGVEARVGDRSMTFVWSEVGSPSISSVTSYTVGTVGGT